MKLYRVTYEGLWMGGEAIVLADNAARALELAKQHEDSVNFEKPWVEQIYHQLTDEGVVSNDNGNY